MHAHHGPFPAEEADVSASTQSALGCLTGAVAACLVAAIVAECRYLLLAFWATVPIAAVLLVCLCIAMETRWGWRHFTTGASLGWHLLGPVVAGMYLLVRAAT